jgi:peptidoglycan/LPS O-acetylase OafA/YrhL
MTPKENDLDFFHGLRCVGSVLIILYHSTFTHWSSTVPFKSDPFWKYTELQLSQLVDLFLWISGFVNYISLRSKYIRSQHKIQTFVLAQLSRALRLYPVVLIGIVYLWKINPYHAGHH